MFSGFFTGTSVRDWPTAKTSDTALFGRYFQGMLERGVYLAPSQFEAGFISTAHDENVLDATLEAAQKVFKTL
jgi:glutamate-1-semialdehyde 2,1-aminomutase